MLNGNLHVRIAPRVLSICFFSLSPSLLLLPECFFVDARACSHNILELRERERGGGRTSGYFLSVSAICFVKNNTFTIPERRLFSLSLSYKGFFYMALQCEHVGVWFLFFLISSFYCLVYSVIFFRIFLSVFCFLYFSTLSRFLIWNTTEKYF